MKLFKRNKHTHKWEMESWFFVQYPYYNCYIRKIKVQYKCAECGKKMTTLIENRNLFGMYETTYAKYQDRSLDHLR